MMGDSGEAKESKPGDMKGKSLTCPPGVSAVCVAGYTVAAGYAWLAGVSPLLAGRPCFIGARVVSTRLIGWRCRLRFECSVTLCVSEIASSAFKCAFKHAQN